MIKKRENGMIVLKFSPKMNFNERNRTSLVMVINSYISINEKFPFAVHELVVHPFLSQNAFTFSEPDKLIISLSKTHRHSLGFDKLDTPVGWFEVFFWNFNRG